MIIGCVVSLVTYLNKGIAHDGISDTISPGTLITGRVNPSYKEIHSLIFRDYVQAHVPSIITNTNESKTTGAIALYPSRNG